MKKVPDVTFIGDEGIDAEGLTKEFFTLVMNALTSGPAGHIMFEGGSDHLVPVISEECYQSGYFRFAGQLIAMSVLHRGIDIGGLSGALTIYMVTDVVELASCNYDCNYLSEPHLALMLVEAHNKKLRFGIIHLQSVGDHLKLIMSDPSFCYSEHFMLRCQQWLETEMQVNIICIYRG